MRRVRPTCVPSRTTRAARERLAWQIVERTAHEVFGFGRFDHAERIDRVGARESDRVDIGDFALAIAQLVATQIARDAAQERAEPARIAKLMKLRPTDDECVLRNIFARREVTRRRECDRRHRCVMTFDKTTERA